MPAKTVGATSKATMFLPLPLLEQWVGKPVTVLLKDNTEVSGVLQQVDDDGKFNLIVSDAEVKNVDVVEVEQNQQPAAADVEGEEAVTKAPPVMKEEFVTTTDRSVQHILLNGANVICVLPKSN